MLWPRLCNNYTSHTEKATQYCRLHRIEKHKIESATRAEWSRKKSTKTQCQRKCKTQDQWTFRSSIIYAQTHHGLERRELHSPEKKGNGTAKYETKESKTAPSTDIDALRLELRGNGNMICAVKFSAIFPPLAFRCRFRWTRTAVKPRVEMAVVVWRSWSGSAKAEGGVPVSLTAGEGQNGTCLWS